MANEEWTTLVIVKSEEYLGITTATNDDDLIRLIREVTARMYDFLDNSDIDIDDPGAVLECACAKQVAYEWRRRKDQGLTVKTYPDGSASKFEIDEWLPDVLNMLARKKEFAI